MPRKAEQTKTSLYALKTTLIWCPQTSNIPGYQTLKETDQLFTLHVITTGEIFFFFLFSFFFFLVHLLSVATVSTQRSLDAATGLLTTLLKLSAAVFSTLKLQNSKVISGSHHVDQLVEERQQRRM